MDLKIDETIESIIETSTTEFNREHVNSIAKQYKEVRQKSKPITFALT